MVLRELALWTFWVGTESLARGTEGHAIADDMLRHTTFICSAFLSLYASSKGDDGSPIELRLSWDCALLAAGIRRGQLSDRG
jgi:hypothetical protein